MVRLYGPCLDCMESRECDLSCKKHSIQPTFQSKFPTILKEQYYKVQNDVVEIQRKKNFHSDKEYCLVGDFLP